MSSLKTCLLWTVILWVSVVFVWYFRFSAWFFEPIVLALKYLLVAIAVVVTVPTLLLARRSPLLMSGVVLFALCCATFVGWWQFAPRLWFFVHRPVFEVARVVVDPGTDYYGAALPFPLRFLSETGTVSSVVMSEGSEAGAFFPQWVGIPDDAGGYLYSTTSPVGADLYGSLCTRPQDLGGGWWMCNLTDP